MPKRKIHKSKLSIIDFQKKFNTEDKCREFLFELRFPQGFVCPECGCTEYYHIKKRHTYQCKCCRHQTSVTSGTVMDKTHLKLTYWLWAMFLFANDKRGCSASYLSQTLKLPYKTAWFLLQRLRSAMSNRENKYLLDGIVELDDTYIGTSDHGKKPLLRALITAWNASISSFISRSFAIISTDAHIMKTCLSVWLWRALTALSADLRGC